MLNSRNKAPSLFMKLKLCVTNFVSFPKKKSLILDVLTRDNWIILKLITC